MKYFEFSEFNEILFAFSKIVLDYMVLMRNPVGLNEIYHEIHNEI